MGPETVQVRPDNPLVGSRGRIRQAIVLKADDFDAIGALPDVARIEVGPLGRLARLYPAAGVHPVTLSNRLRARPDVTWAHPDVEMPVRKLAVPNDPLLDQQWHLINTGQRGYVAGVDINVSEAWQYTHGAGVRIAVLDTGIDTLHPDLMVTDGWDYVDGDDSSQPPGDDPHGTAVAGIAAGIGNNGLGTSGIAYEGDLYGIRIVGGSTSMYDTYVAFVEATDAGAAVLNNSWGFDSECSDMPLYSELEDAFDYAEEEGRGGLGAAVVFSAGNGNCDIGTDGLQSHYAVVSVAAVDGYDVREDYSAFGEWVDISAPSGSIATTDISGPDGYGDIGGDDDYTDTFNGTSASAPVISGVFALMFAANERLSAADARDVMCDTAVRMDLNDGDWDERGWSPFYGCGRVDAGAAVRFVFNEGPPEAPQITAPQAEAIDGAVVLAWNVPLDPDGDRLAYRVQWWETARPETIHREDTEAPWIDMSETIYAGADITWKARAKDLWGSSEWSDEHQFLVVKPHVDVIQTEARSGCSIVSNSAQWVFLALLPLVCRRRMP
ncbi:MAG: S8 family serine peptidase [Rhodobacterales bacterium]|nr:S8 family serine peptidase [Rhodobacterales bacterium]